MPPPPAHYNVYREQLASLYHGCALWEPDPANIYDCVQVGDVGYLSEGYFFRMFNVLLPADDPSNQTLGNPSYEPLNLGPFANIRESRLSQGDYYSRNVSTREHNIGAQAQVPGAPAGGGASVAYRCRRKLGASLKLPFEARRADAIRTKAFEDYTRDNCDNWLAFAQRNRLGVERMEDIILVSGCTVASAWAATAFVNEDMDAEITLSFQAFGAAGANFGWHVGQESVQSVAYHNSRELPDPPQNQCVFIRGFRAKRILGFFTRARAAAEPLPDDPDNEPETGPAVSVSRIPDVPAWRDPLVGVLDYIAEKCPDQQIAIAHDDDLQLIEEVETLTADAVENFLRQNEIGVLVENGAAILVADEENEVPEDTKAIFYARAETEGELLPLVVHPVLLKYLLKLDPATQPPEHDFDLPPEETTAPAVHPPVPTLHLESDQGYPAEIDVRAAPGAPPETGVTVQDVLRAVGADLRRASRRREWAKLTPEQQRGVDAAFRRRCRTEEELGQGPSRVDYLCGRDRLQVFPKLSHDGVLLPLAPAVPPEPLDESNVAGPSRLPGR